MSYDDKSRRDFPFEDQIRTKFHSFRTRRVHGLSSLIDLITLIIFVSLGVLLLSAVWFGLVLVLFLAPIFILASAALRWLGPKRAEPYTQGPRRYRDADVTIIDIEVDKSQN